MKVKAAVTLGYQQPFSIKNIQVSAPKKDEVMVKLSLQAFVIPTR